VLTVRVVAVIVALYISAVLLSEWVTVPPEETVTVPSVVVLSIVRVPAVVSVVPAAEIVPRLNIVVFAD
jgi:hypothetical protein